MAYNAAGESPSTSLHALLESKCNCYTMMFDIAEILNGEIHFPVPVLHSVQPLRRDVELAIRFGLLREANLIPTSGTMRHTAFLEHDERALLDAVLATASSSLEDVCESVENAGNHCDEIVWVDDDEAPTAQDVSDAFCMVFARALMTREGAVQGGASSSSSSSKANAKAQTTTRPCGHHQRAKLMAGVLSDLCDRFGGSEAG